MTVVTSTHWLRPTRISTDKPGLMRALIVRGLLVDEYGRKFVLLDHRDVEQRLKERGNDDRVHH